MTRVAMVLAAGESKRLGQPKQLLQHEGETLVRRAVRKSREAEASHVIVVTGAFAEDISAELRAVECQIVHNENWQTGMGHSIACGAEAIASTLPTCELVLLQLCDQPFIPVAHLKSLLADSELTSSIAATSYLDSTHGPPACFPARYLDALSNLSGTRGAKSLLATEKINFIACEEAAMDIDVVEDLRHLQ